ncbi:TetR/AcrR family transcriptional regulator [Fusobacterium simiae]|uniref:TetR/AcrR family transcriptional regulator n=1 Tax=Fusobacterium simiae TaxID=855 RepID=A0ABT4DK87_FUSSI|nr:TetR/AcrR family transcriptional regulator [Fusobacterium simiae]MCY7008388.1 TetR/AcrR family transcriptional regulator [Fusobacterium simiae]
MKIESCKNYNEKDDLIMKIAVTVRQRGVNSLKIDDFTKYMDISKATFYKYFKDKNDVINSFVENYIENSINFNECNSISLLDKDLYFIIFQKILYQFTVGSQIFLNDIKELYSDLWEKIQLSIFKRNENIVKIYQNSIEAKILENVNPHLLVLQDEVFFSQITQNNFLVTRNLTIQQAIKDYFYLRVNQLFIEKEDKNSLLQKHNEQLSSLINCLSLSML